MKEFKLKPLLGLIETGDTEKIKALAVYGLHDDRITPDLFWAEMNETRTDRMDGFVSVRDGYVVIPDADEYLEDDYHTRERLRKKQSRSKRSDDCPDSKKLSGQVSGKTSGHGKTQKNGAFLKSADERSLVISYKNNSNTINNKGRLSGEPRSLTECSPEQQQAFDLLCQAYVPYRLAQPKQKLQALDAFIRSGLSMDDVKTKVIPAIEFFISKHAWGDRFAPSLESFLTNKLYQISVPKNEELSVKDALLKSDVNIERYRAEDEGKLTFVQKKILERNGGDEL